jgi:hypothetical protein
MDAASWSMDCPQRCILSHKPSSPSCWPCPNARSNAGGSKVRARNSSPWVAVAVFIDLRMSMNGRRPGRSHPHRRQSAEVACVPAALLEDIMNGHSKGRTILPLSDTEQDLLTREEAARVLGMSVSSLAKARARGDGPRFARFGTSVALRPSPSTIKPMASSRAITSTSPARRRSAGSRRTARSMSPTSSIPTTTVTISHQMRPAPYLAAAAPPSPYGTRSISK